MVHPRQLALFIKINTSDYPGAVGGFGCRVVMKEKRIRVYIIYDLKVTCGDIRILEIYLSKSFHKEIWILAIQICFAFVGHIRIDKKWIGTIPDITFGYEAVFIKLVLFLFAYCFFSTLDIIEDYPLILMSCSRETIFAGTFQLSFTNDVDSTICDLMFIGECIYINKRIFQLIDLCLSLYDHDATIRYHFGIGYIDIGYLLDAQYGCLQIIGSSFGEKSQSQLASTCRGEIFTIASFRHIKVKYLFVNIPLKLTDTSLEIIISKLSRDIRCIGLEITNTVLKVDLCIYIWSLESDLIS